MRRIKLTKIFTNHDFSTSPGSTFGALNAAREWLRVHGFSVGTLCSPSPCVIKRGDWNIAKWKNLNTKEREDCDGYLHGEYREGPVTVDLFVDL